MLCWVHWTSLLKGQEKSYSKTGYKLQNHLSKEPDRLLDLRTQEEVKLEGLCWSLKKANKVSDNIDVYVDLSLLKNLILLTLCFHLRSCLATCSPEHKILQGRHFLTENQLEKKKKALINGQFILAQWRHENLNFA